MCDNDVKSEGDESPPSPATLLNTVVMIVRPNVPLNGSDSSIKEMTAAMRWGKYPMPCSVTVAPPKSVSYSLRLCEAWPGIFLPGMNRMPVPTPVKAIIPNTRESFSRQSAHANTPMPMASMTEPSMIGCHVCRGYLLHMKIAK